MPRVKKTIKKVAARPSRIARPAHKTAAKSSRSSRSLSEVRLQRFVKAKIEPRRTSVVSQSNEHVAQKSNLSASVYDIKGKAVGRVTLPSEIFGVAENRQLLAQAVRVYLANQRMGTASSKTRGEVRGSTRKIRPQKGSGHARHGAIRAPIFVHGGIAHGPRPRDYSLSFPQKMRRQALYCALSGKLRDGEIKVMDIAKIQPKTKIMANALESLDLAGKILLVTPQGLRENENIYKASRNLEGVRILPASTLNTYEVLNNNSIILIKEAVDVLKKHYLGGK